MAARPNSSGPDSSASSAGELPNIAGLNKMGTLPEEWTLPHEWKIEKRELFSNWKMDVQSQISNIERNLSSSLQEYPHPEVGSRLQSLDLHNSMSLQNRPYTATNQMQLGLNRSISYNALY